MLFDIFEIREKRLQNRLCAAPLASLSGSADGLPTERSLEVYGKIAASGVALVNVEHHAVNSTGRVRPEQFLADSDEAAAAHAKIAGLIKNGGKISVAQISHGGANISSDGIFGLEGFRCLSPSGVRVGTVWEKLSAEPEKLSLPEIKKIVEDFAAAAERLVRMAGYDGVMIHAAHGYLAGQFLSPLTNLRDDAYGGTGYRRARFLYEITDAVRRTLPDAVVSVRLGAADTLPDEKPHGLAVEDTVPVARELAALGVDLISVSGNLCGYGMDRTNGSYFAPYAAAIREAVGGKVPVECTGGIRGIKSAEKLLGDGCCDLIGVGRPLVADAGFLDKWRDVI